MLSSNEAKKDNHAPLYLKRVPELVGTQVDFCGKKDRKLHPEQENLFLKACFACATMNYNCSCYKKSKTAFETHDNQNM